MESSQNEQQIQTQQQHMFGQVLEFLLNSFRAKLTICSGGKNRGKNASVVEECPFNFNHFLAMGKTLISSHEMRQRMLQDLRTLQREGIFDSITPFLVPFTRPARFKLQPKLGPTDALSIVPSIDVFPPAATTGTNKSAKHKSSSLQRTPTPAPTSTQHDYPIVIHISDEVKGVQQDFQCQQSVLVDQMGYFSLIMSKGQKLHDMDITIHCDVTIFEWLMKWICHHTKPNTDPPELDTINVVGLTVSSDFLKMPALKSTCLNYLKANIQLVIANSPNLGCLSDSLMAEFASELDVFMLEDAIVPADRMDRITSKLYSQFILELNNPTPNERIGHYSSTATLFHCKLCDQLVTNDIATKITCTCIKFDGQGKLYSCHEKNDNWTLGSHIVGLKRELKSWRKVYWRLWASVHFFQCVTCRAVFPGTEYKHCRFHPENPRFLVEIVPPEKEVDKEKSTNIPSPNARGAAPRNPRDRPKTPEPPEKEYVYKPYGRFACCKALTYKYLTSPNLSGCRTKEHTITAETEATKILYKFQDLIACDVESYEPSYRHGASTHSNLIQLSIGKSVYPPTVSSSSYLTTATKSQRHEGRSSELRTTSSSIKVSRQSHTDAQEPGSGSDDEDSSSDSDDDDEGGLRFPYLGSPGYASTSCTRYEQENWIWNNELSTRYNQDMQRETEEKLMMDLTLFLAQRVPIDSNFDVALSQFTQARNVKSGRYSLLSQENSGSFVKLEQMWMDEQNTSKSHRSRSSSSSVL